MIVITPEHRILAYYLLRRVWGHAVESVHTWSSAKDWNDQMNIINRLKGEAFTELQAQRDLSAVTALAVVCGWQTGDGIPAWIGERP